MNDQIQPLLDNLNGLLTSGRHLGGNVWIDEEQFFTTTTQLKRVLQSAVQSAMRGAGHTGAQTSLNVIRPIDDFEALVNKGRSRVFGKVSVNQREYLEKLRLLSAALERI